MDKPKKIKVGKHKMSPEYYSLGKVLADAKGRVKTHLDKADDIESVKQFIGVMDANAESALIEAVIYRTVQVLSYEDLVKYYERKLTKAKKHKKKG